MIKNRKNDSKNVSSFNWDLIESIMQLDPEAWDNRARLELGKMALLEDICNYAEYLEVPAGSGTIPKISIWRNGIVNGDFVVKVPDTYPQIPGKTISVYTFRDEKLIYSAVHDISIEMLNGMTYEIPDFASDTAFTAVGILAAAPIAVPVSIVGYAKGAVGSMETDKKAKTVVQNLEFSDYANALEMGVVISQIGEEALIVNQVSMDVCALEEKLDYYNSKAFNISQYEDELMKTISIEDTQIGKSSFLDPPYSLDDILNGLNPKDYYSEMRLNTFIKLTQNFPYNRETK